MPCAAYGGPMGSRSTGLSPLWSWCAAWWPDVALAGVLTVIVQATIWVERSFPGPTWVNAVAGLVSTGALLWRRQQPVAVLAVVVTVTVLQALAFGATESAGVLLPFLAAVYAAAVYGEPAYVVAALGLLGIVIHDLRDPAVTSPGDVVFSPLVVGTVFVLGRILSGRRTHALAAEARADQVERDREQRVAEAVADERRRIGRELHDVVAHSVSVMALQAGAAGQVLDRSPERAREALRIIQQTGHEAVREMGRLLSLEREGAPEPLEPVPSLRSVPALVEQVRTAGLDTDLVVEGEARPLPAAVELSLFRIAQEGLTNALKHAPRARTPLYVRYRQECVEIEVLSIGPTTNSAVGTGRGLIGIAERVEFAGGQLDVGPCAEGGWRLHAVLPVTW